MSDDTLKPPGPRLDRSRSKAPSAPKQSESRKPVDKVPVPVLKGRLLDLLGESDPRVSGEEPLQFDLAQGRQIPPVRLDTPDKRAAAALACILLENLRRKGGSRVPAQALNDVLEELLPTLTARDMMQIEVEAYEMLEWIGRTANPALDGEPEESDETEPVEYDPDQAHSELVRRAISEEFDLRMMYYTGSRGELTTRRITPHRIEAEKYLHAFCHSRQDTRVFRLSRIARLEPVGGVPVKELARSRQRQSTPVKKLAREEPTPQKSLFDGD